MLLMHDSTICFLIFDTLLRPPRRASASDAAGEKAQSLDREGPIALMSTKSGDTAPFSEWLQVRIPAISAGFP
jgi:hypothetical protein